MDKTMLTVIIVITTIIIFIIEQIHFCKRIRKSNNEVKKAETYCDLIVFKTKYDLLPNKKRLEKHEKLKCVIDNVYGMDEVLSIHMNFNNIKIKAKRITLESLKESCELLDSVDKADDDIKELFREAISINENLVKLYSNAFFFWTYYSTKLQIDFIFAYMKFRLFVAEYLPIYNSKNKSIKKDYLNKDENIVDSVMYAKFCNV
jgi:hypothetical protein